MARNHMVRVMRVRVGNAHVEAVADTRHKAIRAKAGRSSYDRKVRNVRTKELRDAAKATRVAFAASRRR